MKYLYFCLATFLVFSCKSPAELMKKGNYQAAFDKAVKQVKKKKNVERNTEIIQEAAKMKVDAALRYSHIKSKSEKVKDWVQVQKKLYKALEDIGQANLLLQGLISEPYDALCSEKKDVDYQIVEYYYDEGHDHLDDFYYDGQKEDAREAYYSFKKCEKYEGQTFFHSLAEDTNDAYENGIVYYVSDYGNIGSRLFLKPLPRNADFKPDCDISVSHGFVSFSESESTEEEVFTKEIETGKEEVTDTSGHVTYIPIYETISATVITKTITITASVSTDLWCKNITGQCSVGSSSYTTSASDSYEEVSVEGDDRALIHHVTTCSGPPVFFKSNLEDSLIDEADEEIGI